MAAVRQAGQFDDGLMEVVERWLERAFHPSERSGESALAEFDGRRRGKNAKTLQLKNTSSLWTRRHQASETRKAQYSKPLLHPDDWSSIAVVRAVNQLPELSLCWVKFKYMPVSNEQFNYGTRFGRMFWISYQHHFPEGTMPATKNTVKRLADTIILSECNLALRMMLANAKVWEVFRIERDTWYKTYRSHWRNLLDELYSIHGEALMGVYGKI